MRDRLVFVEVIGIYDERPIYINANKIISVQVKEGEDYTGFPNPGLFEQLEDEYIEVRTESNAIYKLKMDNKEILNEVLNIKIQGDNK